MSYREGGALLQAIQPNVEQLIASLGPSVDLHSSRFGSITADAQRRISSWAGIGYDGRENRVLYSQDISQTPTWSYTRATNISATEFKEDGTAANTHYLRQEGLFSGSGNYTISGKVKRGSGSRDIRIDTTVPGGSNIIVKINLATGALLSIANGTLNSLSGPDADGYYAFSFSGELNGSGGLLFSLQTTAGLVSYDGDNTSSIHIKDIQVQSALTTDTRYVATTTAAVYPQATSPAFTNATDAEKPLLTRADNRENRVLQSELLTEGTWARNFLDAPTAQSDPFGGTRAWRLTPDGDGSTVRSHYIRRPYEYALVAGQRYRHSVIAKRVAGNANLLSYTLSSPAGINFGHHWNLTTGAANSTIATTGVSNVTWTSDDLGGGWFRVTSEFTASVSLSVWVAYYVTNSTYATGYVETGEVVDIMEPQLQPSLADPTYIPTTDHPQLRGVNGRQAVWFDGVDDRLSITDFIGTDARTFFIVAGWESHGGNNAGQVISNNSFLVNTSSANSRVQFTSDGGSTTYIEAANNTLTPPTSTLVIAGTQTAAGVGNIYINGALSGAADQARGTPAAATTALFLGNREAGDRAFHGPMTRIIAYPRVLPNDVIVTIAKGLARDG